MRTDFKNFESLTLSTLWFEQGTLVYIASTDLLPGVLRVKSFGQFAVHLFMFAVGVGALALTTLHHVHCNADWTKVIIKLIYDTAVLVDCFAKLANGVMMQLDVWCGAGQETMMTFNIPNIKILQTWIITCCSRLTVLSTYARTVDMHDLPLIFSLENGT